MEVKSNKYRNRSIKIEGKKVEFDSRGIANVSKELGELINSDYNEVINSPKIVKNPDILVSDSDLKKSNEDLTSKNALLVERLETATQDIEDLKIDVENWKEQFTKASESNGGESNKETSKQDIELIVGLFKNNKGELESMATELKLPNNEWSELNKEDLIVYLAYKAINANS